MQKFLLEMVWWVITAVLVVAIMYPIWAAGALYPVNWQNIMFIVLFITLTRYMFFLKYTFLAKIQWLKVVFVLITVPVLFLLIEQHNAFQTNLDNIGPEYVASGVSYPKLLDIAHYAKNEFTFFSVGSILGMIAFMLRMIISVWRLINKGTV
jgi:hypothetical protein